MHDQFEAKWIHLQGRSVGFQAESCGAGSRIHNAEKLAARKAMPRKSVNFRAQAVVASRERSDDGKEQRRAAAPNGRVAAPQQIASRAIAQSRKLCAERTDLGGQFAGS